MRDGGDRLADALRELIEEVAATAPPEAALAEAARAVAAATARLRAAGGPPRGHPFEPLPDVGGTPAYLRHSPVSGPRNPIAPPVTLSIDHGVVRGTARFGRAYEGPPGYVHGAFVAAAFDELLGLANVVSGNPGMTVRLNVRYLRATPLLIDVELEGRHTHREGRRIFASGTMRAGGQVTAEAEAVFAELTPERVRGLFASWREA